MMQGRINANFEPVIEIKVANDIGESLVLEAVIDTGFTGYLTLSHEKIQILGLDLYDTTYTILADGSRVEVSLYLVRVFWNDVMAIVLAEDTQGDALLGMQMLQGQLVTIPVRYGETVTIVPLPPRPQP